MIENYEIRVDRPPEVTVSEMIQFIHDAVAFIGGERHPADPLFGRKEVEVRKV